MQLRTYSIAEFGLRYGPKRTKTYALIRNGELAAIRIGRRRYIRHDDAERWLASLPTHA